MGVASAATWWVEDAAGKALSTSRIFVGKPGLWVGNALGVYRKMTFIPALSAFSRNRSKNS